MGVEFDFVLAISAGIIGILVGLTGVGAGALMTPLLIFFGGFPPAVAIATDLLYASITKLVGGLTFLRHGNVEWRLLRPLWAGGLLGSFVGVFLVFSVIERPFGSRLLQLALASIVVIAALALVRRSFRGETAQVSSRSSRDGAKAGLAFGGSAGIGFAMSLTSVGAGALGMALLSKISEKNASPRSLVGTDLLFAVPLALISGASYFFGGLVNINLLANLLLGSLPGVLVGSLLSRKTSPRKLQLAISFALILVAILMVLGALTG